MITYSLSLNIQRTFPRGLGTSLAPRDPEKYGVRRNYFIIVVSWAPIPFIVSDAYMVSLVHIAFSLYNEMGPTLLSIMREKQCLHWNELLVSKPYKVMRLAIRHLDRVILLH